MGHCTKRQKVSCLQFFLYTFLLKEKYRAQTLLHRPLKCRGMPPLEDSNLPVVYLCYFLRLPNWHQYIINFLQQFPHHSNPREEIPLCPVHQHITSSFISSLIHAEHVGHSIGGLLSASLLFFFCECLHHYCFLCIISLLFCLAYTTKQYTHTYILSQSNCGCVHFRTSMLDRDRCHGINGHYITELSGRACYYNGCPGGHMASNNKCYRYKRLRPSASACQNGFYDHGYCFFNDTP